MNKCNFTKQISSYIDGQLGLKDKQILDEHLKTCVVCQEELKNLQMISGKINALKENSLDKSFDRSVRDSIVRLELEGEQKMNKTVKNFIPAGVLGMLVIFIVVGITQTYVKRGLQRKINDATDAVIVNPIEYFKHGYVGKLKTGADSMGEQYNPKNAVASFTKENLQYKIQDVTDARAIPGQSVSFTQQQSEPYYGERKALQENNAAMQVFGSSSAYIAKEDKIVRAREFVPIGSYSSVESEGGTNYWNPPVLNTEEYNHPGDARPELSFDSPVSTFSIDVDTASYSNVRRFLTQHQMPPQDAVRIEEMINYFSYNYPQPNWGEPFSITTEIGNCPWNQEHKLLLVGLQAKKENIKNSKPNNLVFLVDVSGSMNDANKLTLLKSSFRFLIEQLRPQDTISIVKYSTYPELVLNGVSGSDKYSIVNAMENLSAGGSTAGADGIRLAYSIAKNNFKNGANNRVILATDGDFNQGISDKQGLEYLIEQERNKGVFLTILGFGMGNLKDNKMEALADKGNGQFMYIDNIMEAKKVFMDQLMGTLSTVAKDVKIQVEFNPAKVKAYRLIGYENRALAARDFNDDTKDAGEIGAGHSVTALYEIITGEAEYNPGVDNLKYQKTFSPSHELLTVKLRYKEPNSDHSKLLTRVVTPNQESWFASDNLRFASSVAEFGLLLRNSPYKYNASYVDVINRARNSLGKDENGNRADFIRLVEIAEQLSGNYYQPQIFYKEARENY